MAARPRKPKTDKPLENAEQKPLPDSLVPKRQSEVPSDENLLPFQSLTIALGWETVIREACPIDSLVAGYLTMKAACDQAGLHFMDAFLATHAEAERGTLTAMMLAHYKHAHGVDYGDSKLAD